MKEDWIIVEKCEAGHILRTFISADKASARAIADTLNAILATTRFDIKPVDKKPKMRVVK